MCVGTSLGFKGKVVVGSLEQVRGMFEVLEVWSD